jgi:hypothetical protein
MLFMKFRFPAALLMVTTTAAIVSGCAVEVVPAPQRVYVRPAPVAYIEPAPTAVVSIYLEPPLFQPPPVFVAWAPPPMLVEAPPMMPFSGAVWIGGYWTWHGNWVWAAGRWASAPQTNYVWVQPYYEHRDAAVVFINGFWAAPGVAFVPPPLTLNISFVEVARGVVPGPRPIGPMGVFLPPPPGSRPGIIVPAPIGTAPAVVMSAPPVMSVGMRVQTTVNNTRITNITNVTNVTVVAPASATATGLAYEATVPAQADLAAALPPVVHAPAPVPQSRNLVPAFVPGRAPAALPPAQLVHSSTAPLSAPVPAHPVPSHAIVPDHSLHPVQMEAPAPHAMPRPQEPAISGKSSAVSASQPSHSVPPVRDDAQAAQQRQMNATAPAKHEKAGPEKSALEKTVASKAAYEKPTHAESREEKAQRLKKEKEELERRAKGER